MRLVVIRVFKSLAIERLDTQLYHGLCGTKYQRAKGQYFSGKQCIPAPQPTSTSCSVPNSASNPDMTSPSYCKLEVRREIEAVEEKIDVEFTR